MEPSTTKTQVIKLRAGSRATPNADILHMFFLGAPHAPRTARSDRNREERTSPRKSPDYAHGLTAITRCNEGSAPVGRLALVVVLANMGQVRPKFGKLWARSGPSYASFGGNCSSLVEVGPKLAKIGEKRPNLANPRSVEFEPNKTMFSKSGLSWPESGRINKSKYEAAQDMAATVNAFSDVGADQGPPYNAWRTSFFLPSFRPNRKPRCVVRLAIFSSRSTRRQSPLMAWSASAAACWASRAARRPDLGCVRWKRALLCVSLGSGAPRDMQTMGGQPRIHDSKRHLHLNTT